MAGIIAFRIVLSKGNIIKKIIIAISCVSLLFVVAINSGSSALKKSMEGHTAGEVLHRDLDTPFKVMQINPVFGVGFGGYKDHGNKSYPHNIALEVFSEFGITGSIILVSILLISLLVGNFRIFFVTANGSYLIMFFFIFITKAMISGDLSGNIVIFAILLSFVKHEKSYFL